jgi:hypothetical protein
MTASSSSPNSTPPSTTSASTHTTASTPRASVARRSAPASRGSSSTPTACGSQYATFASTAPTAYTPDSCSGSTTRARITSRLTSTTSPTVAKAA